MNNKGKAIALMILSALGYALMGACMKMTGEIPLTEKLFFRNFISLLIAVFIILKTGGSFFGHKGTRVPLFMRALFGTLGALANLYAICNLILPDAIMLNQLSPFFAIIFSYLILREKISFMQIMAILVAFIGVTFILKPSSAGMAIFPAIMGVTSGLCAGISFTAIRAIGTKEKVETTIFFFSFFSVLFMIPFIFINFRMPNMKELLFLILAGVSTALGQFSLTAAYSIAPAKEVSIFSYTQVLFADIISFLVWDKIPSNSSFIGYFLIIIAAIFIYIYNNNSKNNKNKQKKESLKSVA